MTKATMVGTDGITREIDITLSPKAQAELDAIKIKVDKQIAPLYKELGVDKNTENLHWTNGEVFVINKKTGKRRELKGTQQKLNNRLIKDAVEFGKESKRED